MLRQALRLRRVLGLPDDRLGARHSRSGALHLSRLCGRAGRRAAAADCRSLCRTLGAKVSGRRRRGRWRSRYRRRRRTTGLSTLAVGARGPRPALARQLGEASTAPAGTSATRKTVFASSAPATRSPPAQMDQAGSLGCAARRHGCADGRGRTRRGAGACRCCCAARAKSPSEAAAVADRFAQGVKSVIDDTRPDMLMVGGGDTALAVFRELGIRSPDAEGGNRSGHSVV